MQLHDIAKLLGLQGVRIVSSHYIRANDEKIEEVKIHIEPLTPKQNCPCCRSDDVIKKGSNGHRKINQLKIGITPCALVVPSIKLQCKICSAIYSHAYAFAEGKERYTALFKAHIYEIAVGSTVEHSAFVTQTPYSTAERFFKEIAQKVVQATMEKVQK